MLNLPNCITLSRIALVVVFTIAATAASSYPVGYSIALASFLLAAISDWADGYIARKYNMVTTFGKLIDPLADKIAVSAAFIYLSSINMCPAWATIIIVGREFLVTGIRQIAQEERVIIAADKTGKLKTCFQLAFCSAVLTHLTILSCDSIKPQWLEEFSSWCSLTSKSGYIAQITFWGAVVLTMYSGLVYALQSKSIIFKK